MNLLNFLLPLSFFDGELGGGGDVSAASPAAEPSGDAASSAVVTETSGAQESIVDNVQVAEEQAEDDPLKDVPTVEELKQMAEQKIPHAEALSRLRSAYEAAKEQNKPFEAWKPVIEQIGDPAQVQANQELFNLLYSPTNDPNDYSTTPFLQRLEQDSPGSVDKLYRDLTSFQTEIDGQRDTVVRHMVRSWGLNPDNIEKYRQLENGQLPVASGIVNPEQLASIPAQFHEGFKSLPSQAQQDILALSQSPEESNRLTAQTYLQHAQNSVESQKFREQIQQQQEAQRKAEEAQLEQTIQTESEQAIEQITSEIYSSIHQSLASQVKISANEIENEAYLTGVMSNLYTLLDPAGRKLTLEPLLQKLNISLDSTIAGQQVPFDQTVQRLIERTSAAKRFEHYGDQRRAQIAKSEAAQARGILTAKLNQIALKLAQPTANARANGNGNLGATARQVPNGNGVQQQNGNSPFALPPGVQPFSPEADAHYLAVTRSLASAQR